MPTSSLILESYKYTANSDTKDKLRYEKEVEKLLRYNKSHEGGDFLVPLSFYLGILENSDPVLFPYMTEEQRNQVLRDLQVTYLLLIAEKQYELSHQKSENVTQYNTHLKKCQVLIDAINYAKDCQDKNIKPAPEQGYGCDEKPVAYLCLSLGQWFAQQMVNITDRTTKTIKENMGWVNEKRLYWVWASSLLKTTLELLPPDFFYTDQAKQSARMPDPYTGTMSWGLYYFRFALNLGLLLKHTISGPWMSKEEKNVPWTERFKTQWAQRKFSLLNDFFWATGNLVCFFWLCGKGAAGTWGDALTIALLVFDISLAVWDYEEQKTRHEKALLDYDEAIARLKKQIAALTANDLSKKQLNELNELKELNVQLSTFERARSQCLREWSYHKISLAASIAYATGLMISFTLLTAPFFPAAATTLASMTIVGAVLCFAFSVIYNGTKTGIEVHKTKMTIKEIKEDSAKRVAAFKSLRDENPDLEDNAKKLIFLEVKKLMVETEYQEKMITYQKVRLIRSIIIESLVPALVFMSLVFLPLGAGLGILAAAIALAIASHFIINAIYKPEKAEIKEFNEVEYQSFCSDPDNWGKKPCKSQGFFKSSEELESTTGGDHKRNNHDPEPDESQLLLT